MIENIIPNNCDDRVLARCAAALRGGALIALPTETTWVAACALSSKAGIKKLRALSGERDERHFTLLCSNVAQFSQYCSIDNRRFRLLNKYMPGPYVFILSTLHGTEKALGLKRSELGVRIPQHPVPRVLIDALGEPLYTITAKRTMIHHDSNDDNIGQNYNDELTPIPEEDLFEEAWELEDIKAFDIVIDTGEDLARHFSTVLDATSDEARILRKGAGEFPA